jgi:hypothetical protein
MLTAPLPWHLDPLGRVGVTVWGLTALRAMKVTTCRRFSSIMCRRSSAVRWISPFSMIRFATAGKSVEWKTFIRVLGSPRTREALEKAQGCNNVLDLDFSPAGPCRLVRVNEDLEMFPVALERATTALSSGIMRVTAELPYE